MDHSWSRPDGQGPQRLSPAVTEDRPRRGGGGRGRYRSHRDMTRSAVIKNWPIPDLQLSISAA